MACAPSLKTCLRLVDANANQPVVDITALNARAVQAMLAAIDVLDLALDRLHSSCGSLPDGEAKEKLIVEKKRLAFILYEVRITTQNLLPETRDLSARPTSRTTRPRIV